MSVFLGIITVIITILLVILDAMLPPESPLSQFERNRRHKLGLHESILSQRYEHVNEVRALQRALETILVVALTLSAIGAFGWYLGIILAFIIGLEFSTIGRFTFVTHRAQKLYLRIEHSVLGFIIASPLLFKILPSQNVGVIQQLGSRDELQYLVEQSHAVLTNDEKRLIKNGLSFGDRQVREIMTPRTVIDTVKNTEFLGPLTLDDLHRTGHSRLPVIKGDIDHIIGILHLQGLLTLDIKRSVTAEKAMEDKVFYIRENQSLQHALTAFIKTRHHLFIVVNEYRETVGLLSLEDVIEALLGRKIVDEFDTHDDLRVVAARNPYANNCPKDSDDV